ncbi:hypothetical protein [Mesorhizobium sp.]|uniref:DUF6931 family protein n=1 Tax=Mesorhizobium sp. TaxID=1871066 RepID=UPI0025C2E488|nr:hypothetical protein [Mesorhizobium sp.]
METAAEAIPPATPAAWICLAAVSHDNGAAHEVAPAHLPAGHAVSAGILAGLARVSLADRFAVLAAFVDMGIQIAETEAQRQAADGY